MALGREMGLTSTQYVAGVEEGRHEAWVIEMDRLYQEADPNGTPFALLDGEAFPSEVLYDPDVLGELIRR